MGPCTAPMRNHTSTLISKPVVTMNLSSTDQMCLLMVPGYQYPPRLHTSIILQDPGLPPRLPRVLPFSIISRRYLLSRLMHTWMILTPFSNASWVITSFHQQTVNPKSVDIFCVSSTGRSNIVSTKQSYGHCD